VVSTRTARPGALVHPALRPLSPVARTTTALGRPIGIDKPWPWRPNIPARELICWGPAPSLTPPINVSDGQLAWAWLVAGAAVAYGPSDFSTAVAEGLEPHDGGGGDATLERIARLARLAELLAFDRWVALADQQTAELALTLRLDWAGNLADLAATAKRLARS
jgi:hypothetical protein